MKFERRAITYLSALIATASLVAPAHAADAVVTDWGKVITLQAGWTVDRMLVFHGADMKNPEGCSLTTNGYIIDENAPGHATFYTILLSALLNSRDVNFVIQGCFESRPRIVSVSIR
jgi:hypothetical protein